MDRDAITLVWLIARQIKIRGGELQSEKSDVIN